MAGCNDDSNQSQNNRFSAVSNHDASIAIYYNDPMVYQKPQRTGDSEIGDALIDLINGATDSIEFAVYGLWGQVDVIKAIEKAIDRGVMVRGVVDKDIFDENYYKDTEKLISLVGHIRTDYLTDIKTLNEANNVAFDPYWPLPEGFKGAPQMVGYSLMENKAIIAVHASRSEKTFNGAIMHNKFFVIDGKKVWTGSSNISNTGTGGYNANIACVIDHASVAKIFQNEFNQMYVNGLFHNNKVSSTESQLVMVDDETSIEVFFSPQDDVTPKAIRPLIQSAKKSINLPMFYLTDKYVTADLIAAHNRGVEVRLIIDATAAQYGYTKHEILRAAGIPVKVENWGGKMHMKSMVVDDEVVVIGSMNFSSSGTRSNDENTLIIRNANFAIRTTEFFDRLWESIPNAYLYKNPAPESHESVNSMGDGIDNDADGLVDRKDHGNPPEIMLPPYEIVPKTSGYKLIKGIDHKNGLMVYLLPNSKYYGDYLVDQSNEFYFPSILEAKAAGFVAFNDEKNSLLK